MSPRFKIFRYSSKSVRRKIFIKYGVTVLLLMTVFTAGFIRVWVNTYNIMYEDKMVVFSFDRTDSGTSITVLGHVFELF